MNEQITSFRDLIAWQKAHRLTIGVYQSTRDFPKEELYGLVNQMRRSAISITSNIAEGFGRRGSKEKIRFYDIAVGSLFELQNQLITSQDLGFSSKKSFEELFQQSEEVRRMLIAMMKTLRTRN